MSDPRPYSKEELAVARDSDWAAKHYDEHHAVRMCDVRDIDRWLATLDALESQLKEARRQAMRLIVLGEKCTHVMDDPMLDELEAVRRWWLESTKEDR